MWQIISIILGFLFLLVLLIEIYKKLDKDWRNYMEFDGPTSYPLFGACLQVPLVPDKVFAYSQKMFKKFPKIHRVTFLHIRVMICYNAEDFESILSGSKTTVKSYVYSFLSNWLGTGLLTSEGAKWQHRRKILTPAFHFSILQGFIKVFHKESKNLIQRLKRDCHRDYLDVIPYISEFSLHSINDTAMGVDSATGGDGATLYQSCIHDMGATLINRLLTPWLHFEWLYKLTRFYAKEKVLVKTLHDYTSKIIRRREKLLFGDEAGDSVVKTESGDNSYTTRKRLAMLDLLLSAKREGLIDDEGVREEVDTFLFEGHDTVSMAICYILFCLANEKTCQEEVRKEIFEVLGDNETPDYDELNNLKYMELCIKEALRLYPSVSFIYRNNICDIKSVTGFTIPKNTLLQLEIYNLHRDPDVWPDPEKFVPERFLPEKCKDRHPFAYLPFSAGPRNCIGQKFAMLEMKAVVCAILREFTLEPVHKHGDLTFKADMVLRPNKDGIRVKFVPIKK